MQSYTVSWVGTNIQVTANYQLKVCMGGGRLQTVEGKGIRGKDVFPRAASARGGVQTKIQRSGCTPHGGLGEPAHHVGHPFPGTEQQHLPWVSW